MISGRRRSVIFFTVLGICLVALALTLNVSWLVLNWRRTALAVFGLIFFLLIIAGMVLNTIFLVREIRRNEQHDSFINAVTHELKTPVASIRLYLQTLQTRELDEAKRREFYRIMLGTATGFCRRSIKCCEPGVQDRAGGALPGLRSTWPRSPANASSWRGPVFTSMTRPWYSSRGRGTTPRSCSAIPTS